MTEFASPDQPTDRIPRLGGIVVSRETMENGGYHDGDYDTGPINDSWFDQDAVPMPNQPPDDGKYRPRPQTPEQADAQQASVRQSERALDNQTRYIWAVGAGAGAVGIFGAMPGAFFLTKAYPEYGGGALAAVGLYLVLKLSRAWRNY